MKYSKFTIHEYRGIKTPIEFSLEKDSIYPLIGVNECGKTTILEALLALDSTADKQNSGRHLKDTLNLYSLDTLKGGQPRVSAEICLSNTELTDYLKSCRQTIFNFEVKFVKEAIREITDEEENISLANLDYYAEKIIENDENREKQVKSILNKIKRNGLVDRTLKKVKPLSLSKIVITRDLQKSGKPYSIDLPVKLPANVQNFLAKEIIGKLDFIIYFDDFRYDVPDQIDISNKDDEWTSILDTLFRKTHNDLKLKDLPDLDPRIRDSVISKAENYLNRTLTEQWEKFHLEERKSLDIRFTYVVDDEQIKLDVKETTEDQQSYFFSIKDRSKGFFWFFNFVMRLEFNPKIASGNGRIIYLLDEPGSYLHARAQDQLCKKLMELSRTSQVFYCTHSHHLLDPHTIPFNSIRIVEKSEEKEISIRSVFDQKTDIRIDAAFQPIFEALQIRPAAIDIQHTNVLVVEGIYDFFCYDIFKKKSDISIVPAVNAHSIQYHISWLMAWGVDYRALWDNDEEGVKKFNLAKTHFGNLEANLRFRLLPLTGKKRKKRLQDLFDKEDLTMIKEECDIPSNSSFNKTVLAFYYSKSRNEIKDKISKKTKHSFSQVFSSLW